MKSIYYIISAFTLLLTGCTDFLDRSPYNDLSGNTVWTSDANALMQLNGVYKQTKNGWSMQGYCYHFTCFGPDGYDYFRNSNIEMATATTRDGIFLAAYQDYYKVINAANDAIANLTDNPNITPKLRERMIGEARFLRGFSYFMLWQLYGGVIILDKPTQPIDTYLPRNTADQVRDFVIEDFKDAIERLPLEYSESEYGRITQGAAVAMLGRTYLYDQRWGDAATELHKLMEEPYKYDLVEDYTKLFDWKYERNTEYIYALSFIAQIGYGTAYDSWYGNRSSFINGESYSLGSHIPFETSTYADGSPIDLSTRPKRSNYRDEVSFGNDLIQWYANVINSPKKLDKRIGANMILPSATYYGKDSKYFKVYWPYEAHVNDDPQALGVTFNDFATYSWRKFVCVGDEGYWAYQGPTDIPLIRFADVLLMYAEAKNEELAAPTDDVYDALNRVRKRAGLNELSGLDKTAMRKAIRMERFHEFPGEGHLFFDVRRWRTAHTNDPVFGLNHDVYQFTGEKLFTRSFPEKFYLWPIPEAERDLNPKLDQNEGW